MAFPVCQKNIILNKPAYTPRVITDKCLIFDTLTALINGISNVAEKYNIKWTRLHSVGDFI